MEKQEVIKKAYGEHWETVKDYVYENGWFEVKKVVGSFWETKLELDVVESPRRVRPKSLQGIENNNGWIKIESEADLPKEEVDYWCINMGVLEHLTFYQGKFYDESHSYNPITYITHYQPIQKPLKPLY